MSGMRGFLLKPTFGDVADPCRLCLHHCLHAVPGKRYSFMLFSVFTFLDQSGQWGAWWGGGGFFFYWQKNPEVASRTYSCMLNSKR